MEEETATGTERAGIEKAIEAKKVEINALELKLNENFDEWCRINDQLSNNEKERKELDKVKAAKVAESKELFLSKLTSFPK
jgi:hypothetical protein